MIMLTASGSFAKSFTTQFDAEIVSAREHSKEEFIRRITSSAAVLHNASSINADSIDTFLENNFDFTRFLVKQLREHSPETHLIFLSSMSILDARDSTRYADILEMTPYAYSKYLAESYILKGDLPHVSCVRFSTLFYKDPAKDGLSKLIYDAVTTKKVTLYNNGEAKRNFIPLDVAAQYVQKIAQQKPDKKETYTLAAPNATSFADVVAILKELVPELEIENKEVATTPLILSDFSTKSIDQLGRIEFSLKDEVTKYARSIK